MDFIDSLFSRKSIRSYTGECVSEKDLNTILLAGNAAPVGKGRYDALHITVISDPSLLEEIDKLTAEYLGKPDTHPLYGAPHLIVVSIKEDCGLPDNVNYSNAAIVAHNMALSAISLNIGTCLIWGAIRAVNESVEIVKKLQLPIGFRPSCAITLGQTVENYSPREIPADKISQNSI